MIWLNIYTQKQKSKYYVINVTKYLNKNQDLIYKEMVVTCAEFKNRKQNYHQLLSNLLKRLKKFMDLITIIMIQFNM